MHWSIAVTTKEQLKKIYDLARVGLLLCEQHKCTDVKIFFRQIINTLEQGDVE